MTVGRPLSLRAFGKRLHVSHTAVVGAVETGRLHRSVGRDARGNPVIVDVTLARQEWRANRARPHGADGASLTEATRQVALERARGLRLANDLAAGRVLDADEVRTRWSTILVALRTKMLGVPTRFKQRRPDLSRDDVVALDELVREALEEFVDERQAAAIADGARPRS